MLPTAQLVPASQLARGGAPQQHGREEGRGGGSSSVWGLDAMYPLKVGASGAGVRSGAAEDKERDGQHWDRVKKSAAILLGGL